MAKLNETEIAELSPKTGLTFGFLMVLAGLLFTGWKFDRISTELETLRWSQATGVIENSKFHTTRRKNSNSISTTYHGKFEYRYTVNGREYTGTRYDTTGNMHTGLESEMQELKNHIRSNPSVTVLFNSDDPSQSLLRNGISEDTSVRLAFSIFFLLAGSITLRYQWKRFRRVEPKTVASRNVPHSELP